MTADVILVTATSFMKSESLKERLACDLRASFPGHNYQIYYLDLRDAKASHMFADPMFKSRVCAWLVGGESVGEAELLGLPNLRLVSKYGVGLDNIDATALINHRITLAFEGGVNAIHVAEHTLGLMIGMMRNLFENSNLLKAGTWRKDGGVGLQGLKVGIVGLGQVGSRLARLLHMFEADLYYSDLEAKPEIENSIKIRRLDYQDLLSSVDLLSFHVPLTDQTYKMFDAGALEKVCSGIFIVNTSRGPVLDQEVLKMGLNSGKIAGVALDVFESEPNCDRELVGGARVFGTPHTAGNSRQAVEAMGLAAIRGILKNI